MSDGTVPVQKEEDATSGTPDNRQAELDVMQARVDYERAVADAAEHYPSVDSVTDEEITVPFGGKPFPAEYVYTVYSFGEQSGNGYNVMASTNRTEANEYARKYRGVVTQQEIISDFRHREVDT